MTGLGAPSDMELKKLHLVEASPEAREASSIVQKGAVENVDALREIGFYNHFPRKAERLEAEENGEVVDE
jgi:hypothetical protein